MARKLSVLEKAERIVAAQETLRRLHQIVATTRYYALPQAKAPQGISRRKSVA